MPQPGWTQTAKQAVHSVLETEKTSSKLGQNSGSIDCAQATKKRAPDRRSLSFYNLC
ncbi:hypothetical protein SAMN05880570_1605 [Paenibacillus sp. RU4T]|nr:hypothetical protein SAMN05880555_1607 [Paenibacillus sp. RU4X]SIQ61648.1 hypothetical protein SAMN05880570_1605 [Paenibacillus sp. RU4T]